MGKPFPTDISADIKEEIMGADAYKFLLGWISGLENLKGHNRKADNRVKGDFNDAFVKYSRKQHEFHKINAQNLQPLVQALMRDSSQILNIWSNPNVSKGRDSGVLLQVSRNACANISRDREIGQVPKYHLMELSEIDYITQGALEKIQKHKEHHNNDKTRPDRILPSHRLVKGKIRGEIKLFESSIIAAIRMGREHHNADEERLLPSFSSAISPRRHKISRFEESFSDAVSRRRASTTQQEQSRGRDGESRTR